MDKAEAKVIQSEVRAAVEAVLKQHALVVQKVGCTYGEGSIALRVSAVSAIPALDPYRRNWERYAESFGLPKDGLDRTFVAKGGTYRVTGLDLGRSKYPVRALNVATGKPILFTADIARYIAAAS